MKKSLNLNFYLASILFCTIAVSVGPSANAGTSHGVVRLVKGDVSYKKTGHAEFEKLKSGSKVHPGDAILAGYNSHAKIVMVDENVISISADTLVTIERYEYDPTRFDKNVVIKLAFGKLRAIVKQRYDLDKNRFVVQTPSAVTHVQGTDFLTIYNSQTNETKVVTFEGGVNFATLDSKGVGGRPTFIAAGHTSSNKIAIEPAPAVAVAANELKKIDTDSLARDPASLPLTKFESPNSGAIQPDHSLTHVTTQDLGACQNCEIAPVGPTLELGGFTSERALAPDTSTCEFCERAIEDGNTSVNIFLVPIGP